MTAAFKTPGLLTPSYSYKPFRYPWAYDFWKRQQQVHWMPEEVPSARTARTGRRT
jgi:ribonucleoside-diphosphate reductase beta chain